MLQSSINIPPRLTVSLHYLVKYQYRETSNNLKHA